MPQRQYTEFTKKLAKKLEQIETIPKDLKKFNKNQQRKLKIKSAEEENPTKSVKFLHKKIVIAPTSKKESENATVSMQEFGKDYNEFAKQKTRIQSISSNNLASPKEANAQQLKPVIAKEKPKKLVHYRSYSNLISPNASTTASLQARPLVIGAPHLERMDKGMITKPRKMRQLPVDIKFRTGESVRLVNHFSIIQSNKHVTNLTSPITSLDVHRKKANLFTQFGSEQYKQKFQVQSKIDSGYTGNCFMSFRASSKIPSAEQNKRANSGRPSSHDQDSNRDPKTYDNGRKIFKQL